MYEFDNINKFDSVEVTLKMGCSIDCRYCPQKLLLGRYFQNDKQRKKVMDMETFQTVLTRVKQGGTIVFSGMSEPFSNEDCLEMLVYASDKGYRIMLLTTLVGCNRYAIDKMAGIDFDGITLHLPDQEENSHITVSDEYISLVKYAHEKLKITSYSCHGTLHPKMKNAVDETIYISSVIMNRAGNLSEGIKKAPKGEIVCMVGNNGRYGNWTPEILPDGTVLLCCMDYGMRHILGNVNTMDAGEMMEGEEYQKIKCGMKDDSEDILCRYCTGAMEKHSTPAYRFKEKYQEYLDGAIFDKSYMEIFERIENASDICVYGLGKLFWNNFSAQCWLEVLNPSYYSDKDDLWRGKDIYGSPFLPVDELRGKQNTLVVLHVEKDTAVKRQLEECGITNVISIKELYDLF